MFQSSVWKRIPYMKWWEKKDTWWDRETKNQFGILSMYASMWHTLKKKKKENMLGFKW